MPGSLPPMPMDTPAYLLSELYLLVSCRLSMLRSPPMLAVTLSPATCEPMMLVSLPVVMLSWLFAVTVLGVHVRMSSVPFSIAMLPLMLPPMGEPAPMPILTPILAELLSDLLSVWEVLSAASMLTLSLAVRLTFSPAMELPVMLWN